jgi:hypothetical protein
MTDVREDVRRHGGEVIKIEPPQRSTFFVSGDGDSGIGEPRERIPPRRRVILKSQPQKFRGELFTLTQKTNA